MFDDFIFFSLASYHQQQMSQHFLQQVKKKLLFVNYSFKKY